MKGVLSGAKLPIIAIILFSVLVTIDVIALVPVHAELMKLDFKGSITSISPPYAPPGINLGDEVVGELIYDPETPDGQPITWMGYYEDAIKKCKLIIGNTNYPMRSLPESSEIDVINDDMVWDKYYDSIYFRVAVLDQSFQVYRFFQLTFSLVNEIPPTVLTSDALAVSIDINAFAGKSGFLTYMPPGSSSGNNITLISVHLYPVPEQSLNWGDINGDLTVNLPDAILGLQVISNMSPTTTVYTNADVNGDEKIGLAEVIYILRWIGSNRAE